MNDDENDPRKKLDKMIPLNNDQQTEALNTAQASKHTRRIGLF